MELFGYSNNFILDITPSFWTMVPVFFGECLSKLMESKRYKDNLLLTLTIYNNHTTFALPFHVKLFYRNRAKVTLPVRVCNITFQMLTTRVFHNVILTTERTIFQIFYS